MPYARLLRTLFVTLAAAVTLPMLGAGAGVEESREVARAARDAQAAATAGAAGTSLPDPTVLRVATAASSAQGLVGLAPDPTRQGAAAEPPAVVLFFAALFAIIFISTRRSKDR
ncbi:MAG: hypothetical protein JNJ71_10125 [Rubrivivax sp.]|nr:hypothetical protein [Rubrivivax sp.]